MGGKKVASGNAALSMALTDWCFKQSGVLKVESISHHKAGEKSPPAHYTIKDDAVYTMENKAGHMIAKFKVPDTYGVYQFKVNYNRVGLSRLSTADQISVIPLRHDKYERFIGQAYPYYASAFSMMAGVFV